MASLKTKLPNVAAATLAGLLTIAPTFHQTAQATEEHYQQYTATSQRMDSLRGFVKNHPDGVAAIVFTQPEQERTFPASIAAAKIDNYLRNRKGIEHVSIVAEPDPVGVSDSRVVFYTRDGSHIYSFADTMTSTSVLDLMASKAASHE